MSYVKHILQPGENVLVDGRLHWIIYVPAIFWFILTAVAAYAAYYFRDTNLRWFAGVAVTALLLAVALVSLVRAWWHAFTVEIAVTNRVIYNRGFINRHTDEMNIDKIESVIVDQSILGRILDYGTISIRGTGASIEQLKLIAHAIELRNAITSR